MESLKYKVVCLYITEKNIQCISTIYKTRRNILVYMHVHQTHMCFSSTRKLAEDAAAAATTTDNSEVLVENPSKCSSENVSLLK